MPEKMQSAIQGVIISILSLMLKAYASLSLSDPQFERRSGTILNRSLPELRYNAPSGTLIAKHSPAKTRQ